MEGCTVWRGGLCGGVDYVRGGLCGGVYYVEGWTM